MRYFLAFTFLLGSCATVATKSEFPSNPPVTLIRQVALSITGSAEQIQAKRQADSLFAKELATQLSAATGWQVHYVGKKTELNKEYSTPELFL
jgi:hypothetical protein